MVHYLPALPTLQKEGAEREDVSNDSKDSIERDLEVELARRDTDLTSELPQ